MRLSCSVSLYKTSGWLPGAQHRQSQCQPCNLDAGVLAFALVSKARRVHLERLKEELHGPARIPTNARWLVWAPQSHGFHPDPLLCLSTGKLHSPGLSFLVWK